MFNKNTLLEEYKSIISIRCVTQTLEQKMKVCVLLYGTFAQVHQGQCLGYEIILSRNSAALIECLEAIQESCD